MPNNQEHTSSLSEKVSIGPLLRIIDKASKKVPVVKFAFGLAGIAACGALISALLGNGHSAIVMLALTFLGSILLFVFAKLASSISPSIQLAGIVLLWVVIGFFTTFLLLTTTAFTSEWPRPWVVFLGITPSSDLCNERVGVVWNMFNNPDNQTSDAKAMAQKVERCDPFQAYTVEGALAYYSGDFGAAEDYFVKAHILQPNDDPIKRNLGDALVENGKYEEALAIYKSVSMKGNLLNYKISRVLLFQNRCQEAFNILSAIKAPLNEDGNMPGRVKIAEAATLICISEAQEEKFRGATLQKAEQNFDLGYLTDKQNWCQILTVTQRTKNENFAKIIDILGTKLSPWLGRLGCGLVTPAASP